MIRFPSGNIKFKSFPLVIYEYVCLFSINIRIPVKIRSSRICSIAHAFSFAMLPSTPETSLKNSVRHRFRSRHCCPFDNPIGVKNNRLPSSFNRYPSSNNPSVTLVTRDNGTSSSLDRSDFTI